MLYAKYGGLRNRIDQERFMGNVGKPVINADLIELIGDAYVKLIL